MCRGAVHLEAPSNSATRRSGPSATNGVVVQAWHPSTDPRATARRQVRTHASNRMDVPMARNRAWGDVESGGVLDETSWASKEEKYML